MGRVAREEQDRLRSALRAELTARFGYAPRDEPLSTLVDVLRERLNPGESFGSSLERLRALPLDAPLVQAMVARTAPAEPQFYQGAAAMRGLRDHVLPAILEHCRPSRTLRVWSAGTGTGAELFELSMLLDTMLPDFAQWRISLIGTDIDRAGLQRARDATVPSTSLGKLTALQRSSLFDTLANGLARPKPRYRRHVSFELHNLADPMATPPAPGAFDLVLCRNVARHFSRDARATLASQLARGLAAHGVWVAASADPVPKAGFRTRAVAGMYQHSPRPEDATRALRLDAAQTSQAPFPRDPRASEPVVATSSLPAALERALGEVQAVADIGDLGEAAARLARLDGRAWTRPSTHLLAAMVYDGMGRTADAKAALRRALTLDPQSADTQLRLGLLLARTGERDAAIEALRSALDEAKQGASLNALAVRRVAHAQLTRLLRTR